MQLDVVMLAWFQDWPQCFGPLPVHSAVIKEPKAWKKFPTTPQNSAVKQTHQSKYEFR